MRNSPRRSPAVLLLAGSVVAAALVLPSVALAADTEPGLETDALQEIDDPVGPPAAPTGLMRQRVDGVVLTWHPSSETDLSHYLVLRDTSPVATVPKGESYYVDGDAPYDQELVYEIVAVDLADNASEPSEPLAVTRVRALKILDPNGRTLERDDVVTVQLTSAQDNLESGAVEIVVGEATTWPDTVLLQLRETGVDTGVFEAQLRLSATTDDTSLPPSILMRTPGRLDVRVGPHHVWAETGHLPVCASATEQRCVKSFTVDGLTAPSTLKLNAYESHGTMQMQVRAAATSSYELAPLLTADSVIGLEVNMGSFDAITSSATGAIVSSTITLDSAIGNTVAMQIKPRRVSHLSPGCETFSCGDDSTQANVEFELMMAASADDMWEPAYGEQAPAEPDPWREAYRGSWIATNAQGFLPPSYVAETNALEFQLAAPHLRMDGAPNTGFFSAFIPDPFLRDVLGVADPDGLTSSSLLTTRTDGDTTVAVAPTVTKVAGGVRVELADFGYSTPRFSITPRVVAVEPDDGDGKGGKPGGRTGASPPGSSVGGPHGPGRPGGGSSHPRPGR